MLARSSRAFVALCAIASLLSMQLAVAAYVCPHDRGAAVMDVAQDEPGCHEMDRANPALCYSHCEHQAQSIEKLGGFTVPAAIPAGLHVVQVHVVPACIESAKDQRSILARSTAPPLAIRHCCLRI